MEKKQKRKDSDLIRTKGSRKEAIAIQHRIGFSKRLSIAVLGFVALVLVCMGVSILVLSLVNDVSFTVMGSSIHGSLWGVVITFLGIRYFVSVLKLKRRVYQSASKFSIRHFKGKVTA
ncbi:MAG TPA: hypothetical protein DCQ90_08895 [Erysipelotrichaceae bacterium]|nr:hypothetical protein [Erysipelotrichaceae bacterium]